MPIIIELSAEEIILLNQAQLFTQSVDKDGDALGGYATIEYEELKRGLNPSLDGLVDLRLTGDFYGGFYVSVNDTEFIIGSTDEKETILQNRYGKAIFGLTDSNKAQYTKDIFFKALKNYLQNMTGFGLQ